ncbi:hypothetical protein [Herbiconiux solani]|uniref:hypothetical protein n=1 Tax=Herbiconiux solani TaxID=661329 RepID=UPI0008270A4E|nr:hypothetical protein [Herbiconiux solani]
MRSSSRGAPGSRRVRGAHRAVGAALCLSVVGATLAGCSLRPDPPAELKAAAAELAGSVDAVPGIRAVDVTVRDVDFKDKPGEWYLDLRADADTAAGIETVPAELAPVLADARREGLTVRLALRIPGGTGAAPTTLGAITDGAVRAAVALRSDASISSVDGAVYGSTYLLTVDDATSLTAVIPALRDALTAGEGAVPAVSASWNAEASAHHISIEVTPTWPSAELAAVLEQIGTVASLSSLSTSAETVGETGASVVVDVDDPRDASTVADLLLDVADGGTVVPAHFWVHGPDGTDFDGILG